jgi:hypothetical protein
MPAQKISSFLWSQANAMEAVKFYASVFGENCRVSGTSFELFGQAIRAGNGSEDCESPATRTRGRPGLPTSRPSQARKFGRLPHRAASGAPRYAAQHCQVFVLYKGEVQSGDVARLRLINSLFSFAPSQRNR